MVCDRTTPTCCRFATGSTLLRSAGHYRDPTEKPVRPNRIPASAADCRAFSGLVPSGHLLDPELTEPPVGLADAARFRTTHWSMVIRAVDASDASSHLALERLCQAYWPAVHEFIARRGQSPEDAKDLTQGFFARLLEKEWLRAADATKGRFRTFLLTAVTRFLANERERAEALKQGGGQVLFSLNVPEAEPGGVPEPTDGATPEAAFERRWAETLLNRVLERLRQEFDAGGRTGRFQELKSFLTEDRGETSYAEVAGRLGISAAAVKSGIHRLRQRYGELVREEIAETVDSPVEVEAEIRHLLSVLSA